jgi:hypothetical protein
MTGDVSWRAPFVTLRGQLHPSRDERLVMRRDPAVTRRGKLQCSRGTEIHLSRPAESLAVMRCGELQTIRDAESASHHVTRKGSAAT